MNKQEGKQFGEDNPSALLPLIHVHTLTVAERRYHTAFPVSGDALELGSRVANKVNLIAARKTGNRSEDPLTSVATGTGPFPVKYDADTHRAIERETFGRV